MSTNKLKPPPEKPKVEKVRRKKSPSIFSKAFMRFMNMFGFLDRNQIVHAMPFILFVSLLVIGYIANSYNAERIIREIDKTKTELKEKRAEYISTMSRLMYQSNQSEVAKVLDPYLIKESTQPPDKIFITDNKEK
jgi:hypothetical protein